MKNKKGQPVTPDQEEMESVTRDVPIQDQVSEIIDFGVEDAAGQQETELDITLEEQVINLQTSLEETIIKNDEYLDGWQRARAEFANYKKRVLRENMEIRQVARGEVIKLYLDIADDLARALQDKPLNGDGETWAEGIEIIYQKLQTRLETEGIKPMNPLGQEFDPNIHEALMKEESDDYESGQIIEVIHEGYWIGEKVLRPALVRVAA